MTARRGDEPVDHRRLASLIAERDVARAADPLAPSDGSAFEFDAGADPSTTFPQSVASGGPTARGVILWTRLDPVAFDPSEPIAVEVAADPEFERPVYRGVVDDPPAVRAHDHTLKVDLDGALSPDRFYHYRFVHDGTASRVGRCRTLPAPDASPDSLSFAVLACQNYLNGYYGAFDHVAEEDVDFVVHVGDFVYESAEGHFKGVGSPSLDGRSLTLPSGEGRAHGLADYRYLYRRYRTDRHLQRALERHTILASWDDHEIANDLHWDPETDAPRADHPRGDDPEFMTRLAAEAMHAWWEYLPARVGYDPDAERLQDRFTLWRSFRFGDLVDLVLTDERLFRDPPGKGMVGRKSVDPDREPADRSMLGPEQRAWLESEITESTATWTVWADEVPTVPVRVGAGPFALFPAQGGWDGYARERRDLTRAFADADVSNLVCLTGDMHSYLAGRLRTAYRATDGETGEQVGVEFMTPALTSQTVAEALGCGRGRLGRATRPLLSELVSRMNPHLDFFDSHHCGYAVVEFTREDCTYTGYAVDKTVPEGAPKRRLVRLRLPEGGGAVERA